MTSDRTPPRLSVVIPAYNESGNISALVDEVIASVPDSHAFELIVVDDGSRDDTARVLTSLLPTRPALRVLEHRRNAGQSAAISSGVRAARADWIITLDGDGQNDPADIPKLLAWLDAPGRDPAVRLVCGHRAHRADTWVKRWSSRVANAVRGWALQDGTPDTGCGLKLIHRNSFLALPAFDHMHRFLPALIRRQGHGVVSLVVNHRPRRAGQSKYGVMNRLWVGIVDLVGVAWLQRRRLGGEPVEIAATERGSGGAP
jgi:dolichol-phosphate mannosyltransferase